jgi:hypothetical protein
VLLQKGKIRCATCSVQLETRNAYRETRNLQRDSRNTKL